MKAEHETKIISEFPELFQDAKLSPQESCMAWGIDVGDGWYSIVYAACKAIKSHLKRLKDIDEPLDYKFAQIKEKFATIRIYDNGGDEFIDGVIATAEHLSSITCEECGKLGRIHTTGCWLKTLCDECGKTWTNS
jgi:hypothetical protein